MSFGKNLKKIRLEHHLTQMELSKATGINRSAIGMYEQERQNPPFDKLKILADYFHVDMNTLLADGNSTAALSPGELRHLGQYLLLDKENQTAIDKQIDYLLYEQEQEYKKGGAASAS